ncbi:MAG TPA: FlgD immunoglobulin-like domain containing protein, partial [Candidatus Krumholzibacteria bacterium]|nr:FlgD immunoglobulin-like domain containing protein [Candidatus Krumholzibacteria bacterium]
FNPATTIKYVLPSAQTVSLAIYDVRGRLVRALENGRRSSGPHTSLWNGRDDAGQAVSSGVYYVRLAGESDIMTRKIVMLK